MTPPVTYNPVTLFESMHQAFETAVAGTGSAVEKNFLVAGRPVRVRVATTSLADRLLPALELLRTDSSLDPELTLCAWDTASTGVPLPDLPWYGWMQQGFTLGDSQGRPFDNIYTPRGDIRGHHDHRILGRCGEKNYVFFDSEQCIGVSWWADVTQLPWYEIGAPFRTEFNWWFRSAGIQVIHAGAVGTEERCALLAGKGGSGKSTTALTCLDSALYYISDDYCLVEMDPLPKCRSLYSTAKIFYDNIDRVPHLAPFQEEMKRTSQDKALFFVDSVFREKLLHTLPIACILLPHVTGKPTTTIKPAMASEALGAIALSTIHQLTGAGPQMLELVRELVQQVPSYHLSLGTNMSEIPSVIGELLTAH